MIQADPSGSKVPYWSPEMAGMGRGNYVSRAGRSINEACIVDYTLLHYVCTSTPKHLSKNSAATEKPLKSKASED